MFELTQVHTTDVDCLIADAGDEKPRTRMTQIESFRYWEGSKVRNELAAHLQRCNVSRQMNKNLRRNAYGHIYYVND